MASSQGRIELGGFVDGSLRRRGQLLVVVGALLGALVGVTLGLAVDGGAGVATAAPGPGRGTALAAGAPAGQPSTSRAVDGGGGSEDAGPADGPGRAAGKDGDKPDKARPEGRGQDKAGKDERKDKKSERD
jgi:hypothetical protein